MKRIDLVIFLGMLGCGGTEEQPFVQKQEGGSAQLQEVPGSRLEPMFYKGEDGSQFFGGIWDKKLSQPCTFRYISPNLPTRCYPGGAHSIVPLYKDDLCKNVIGISFRKYDEVVYKRPLNTILYGVGQPDLFNSNSLDMQMYSVNTAEYLPYDTYYIVSLGRCSKAPEGLKAKGGPVDPSIFVSTKEGL